VRVTPDGYLQGLGEVETQIDMDKDRAGEGEIILIAHLLGLLRIFLGEALTLSLLRNAWPGAAFDDRNSGNGRTA
jgi:predicted membrane protein